MSPTVSTPAPDRSDADSPALRAAFRGAMANVAAPVSVVTTMIGDVPHGTTVSAFCSLSMEPPMLLVSLDATSSLLQHLRVGSTVGVNVLASHQDQVALRFAQRGVDRFADLTWYLHDGAPALADVHAWTGLQVESLVPAGDHVVVLGRVTSAFAGSHAPLTYWQRGFGTHTTF